MKRGKYEDKMIGPMFPKLHVNDTEKGGPRAPPRNKMALYAQLSIPSQKFTHAKTNSSIGNLVLQSSQGSGNERGMFFPQHPITHQSEKQYSQYSDSSTSLAQIEQRKKLEEDDFRVPISIHSMPSLKSGELKFHKGEETDVHKENNLNPISNLSDLSSPCHETRDKPANSIDRSKSNATVLPENCAKNYDTESRENGSCSMSETSIVDSISELDITPDDVVGVIGQNHFWKARRAIVNQQRAFSVQLFELHRLIKVQRSIATSPHLLQEETTYSGKPNKPSPVKKLPFNHPVKALPNITKKKADPEKPTRKECSAENTIEKSSFSSVQNISTPSFNSSHQNAQPLCISQPHGQQLLIPVMSPSEGLIYKPYLGPGFAGPDSNAVVMGNFVTPPYGYQIPPYHPSFFPPYGMPVMNASSFSNSSVEQTNQFPTRDANFRVQHPELEVQASTASSTSEGENNMLPLFPTNSSPHTPELERPPRVIKVVPHNARTATESVARIFRSIQEERKGCDAV